MALIANYIGKSNMLTPGMLATAYQARVQADGGVVESYDCMVSRIAMLKNLGLWDKASTIWLPHGYKEGKLYAVKGGANADLGFTRGGTRTRKGPTYVEQVPYNLLYRSEEFDNVVWSKGNVTVSANAIVAPNGTITADRIDLSAGTVIKHIQQLSLVHEGEYTVSFQAKYLSHQFIQFVISSSTTPGYVTVDLLNGTINAVTGTGTISALPDGWFKVTFTYNYSGTSNIGWYAVDSLGAARASTTSSVGSYYLWGAQLVVGSEAKDYFKTTDRFNVPALDYTNATCPALSLEPARTNLLLRSEEFDNASWLKNGLTVTANAVVAPDNLSTAGALFETVANTGHNSYQSVTKAASSLQYTFSLYVKANGRSWALLRCHDGTNAVGKFFNLANGTLGSDDFLGTGFTIQSARITPTANGFYRCEITITTNTATTIQAQVNPTLDGATISYAGDITKGIYVWGAQLEQASYATSYIPTTTATVSRIADVVPALTGVSSLIGQDEGTLYFEGKLRSGLGEKGVFGVSNGTVSNRILIYYNDSSQLYCIITAGGITQANIGINNFVQGNDYKVVVVYGANNVRLFINGVKIGEDLTATIPACSRVGFDTGAGAGPLNGVIKNAIISKTALTDAEAITATTP